MAPVARAVKPLSRPSESFVTQSVCPLAFSFSYSSEPDVHRLPCGVRGLHKSWRQERPSKRQLVHLGCGLGDVLIPQDLVPGRYPVLSTAFTPFLDETSMKRYWLTKTNMCRRNTDCLICLYRFRSVRLMFSDFGTERPTLQPEVTGGGFATLHCAV